jgi:hypothetical protein
MFDNSLFADNMMRHNGNERQAFSKRVRLDQQETISYNLDTNDNDTIYLMKAHGIIMIFVWIVLVSTGILIARHFKLSWSNRKICGKPIWFAIHRLIMMIAVTLTLIAFILILVYKKGQWTSSMNQQEFAHSIIGIIVVCFASIQPLMAIFRCNPNGSYRFIFNYVHATVGLSALVLSILAILLAMFFTRFEFLERKQWIIVVAWASWLLIAFILLELIEIYFRRVIVCVQNQDSYDLTQFRSNILTKDDSMQSTKDARLDSVKTLFLAFHIVIAIGLSFALMVLIGQS